MHCCQIFVTQIEDIIHFLLGNDQRMTFHQRIDVQKRKEFIILCHLIADAKIIDESKLKTDSVQILNKVELKNVKNGMKMTYTIVSESEANLKEGKISVNTPIAQGLLGKKVGEVAEIKVPQGMVNLEVMNISF